MAKLNPVAADDESDFAFFQVFPGDKIVNVSIACDLVDRIAGEKLGEPRRLQFLQDQSELFSSVATRKASALGFPENIMLNEDDFPQLSPDLEKQDD